MTTEKTYNPGDKIRVKMRTEEDNRFFGSYFNHGSEGTVLEKSGPDDYEVMFERDANGKRESWFVPTYLMESV